MGKNRETNRMTSIARRINMEFCLRQLGNFFMLDVVLLGVIVTVFFTWCEGAVQSGDEIADRFFSGSSFDSFCYIIETEQGKQLIYYLKDLVELIRVPTIVVLVAESAAMIEGLFGAGKVRRLMRPIGEMAIQAEQLASQPFDYGKFENMEQAIRSLDPDRPDARIITGDKDLQSLEIAINNMLERMRESHRQQERFVSDASHELRTPISVIQGYVNMLDRWGKEDPQILGEAIEAIKNESDHMKNLIEQLLFLARGDSGRNTLTFTDFDLTEMVREVWEESMMIDDTHSYIFDGKEPVMAYGDVAMVKQSLRILVQNASKYSCRGDTIRLAASVSSGRPAYIVQDEGIGMAESEVAHVFERFYRSDAARNSSEGGTGLGLSIAKWIVDAHNGEIEILSRPEFGTRFTVRL
ncbi:sensor histidine kinase [Ihubacter sp. rT4E-8]|uniref:sensor histidine kinase n=1 Tax=unclassified Ihubacter TaxID=2633299 RepID=UPI003C7C6637